MEVQIMRKFLLIVATLALCALVAQAAPPKYDLGGRTIKIASYYDFTGYFADGNGRGRLELVGKMFNCTFSFVSLPWDGGPEKIITSVAAGAPEGDVFIVTNRWIPQLASNGAIMSMEKVLDEAYYKSLPSPHNNMRALYSSFQGKPWAASIKGYFDRNSDLQGSQGWAYNRDMVKAAGLVTPNELQKKNQWTFATMREYAKKLTKDTNGDGTIDVYGVTARLDPWPVDQEMAIYANGGSLMKLKNGKYVFAMNEPQAIAALQLWRDMVNVDKSVLIGDKFDTRAEMLKGTAAMIRNDLYALPEDGPKYTFDWGWVFFPKGPQGSYVNPVWGMDVVLLPVTEKKPRELVEVMSALFEVTSNYRDLKTYNSDILGFFMKTVKDKDSLDTISQMLAKTRLWDNIIDTNAATLINKAMVDAVFGPKSPKAVVDEIAPQVQAAIDATMNRTK